MDGSTSDNYDFYNLNWCDGVEDPSGSFGLVEAHATIEIMMQIIKQKSGAW